MAATRQAFQSATQLQPFIIPNVRAIGKELGIGSYGSVEELDVNGLICAGKKIHNTLIEKGFQGIQNIARKYVEECRLMSDLRHPHIVQFMGVCFLPDSSLPVLVMERLLMSLDDLLEDTPDVPLALKRSILADICKGLVYLHDRNSPIIHRDLSAKNVLLDSNMVGKISDLGNARIVEFQQAQTLSRNPGTHIYMPPEALYGPPGCDPTKSRYGTRIDIFSLGHLALFAVTQVYSVLFCGSVCARNYRFLAASEVKRSIPSSHIMFLLCRFFLKISFRPLTLTPKTQDDFVVEQKLNVARIISFSFIRSWERATPWSS